MNDLARIEQAIGFIPAIAMNRLLSALTFISPVERETWVLCGMAIKSELGDVGFPIWDAWSQGAESYRPESAKSVWKSIKEGGKVTVATLYHHARCHGWRDDGTQQRLTARQIADRRRAAQERSAAADRVAEIGYRKAAVRAATLIKSCGIGTHPYLAEKGFPEARALVTEDGTLVIPMRDCVSDALVGAQVVRLVDNSWEKKMLPGMRAKGAALRIGNHRTSETWLVEGYATGLSVDAALKLLRLSASVLVCFSAHNLVHVAGRIPGRRFVFADHDSSRAGETAAIATGLPYAMAPIVGQDANDLHRSEGAIAVAKLIMEARTK